MCIAVYKPLGVAFPSKKTLQVCFDNNPDGAGFMVADGNTVHIHKGYMSFGTFWKGLKRVRSKYGDDCAYVMHFRITTQAGVRADCTHPFPLSNNMDDMRKLTVDTPIGIVHNGMISLTSTYARNVTYSDTMAFITDYASLIISGEKWYEEPEVFKSKLLLERLIGASRLAILSGDGHCELLGTGWVKEAEVWYSNTSYKVEKVRVAPSVSHSFYNYYDDYYYGCEVCGKWNGVHYDSALDMYVCDDCRKKFTETEPKAEPKVDLLTGFIEYDPDTCPYAESDGEDIDCCDECMHQYKCKNWGWANTYMKEAIK